MAALSRLMQPPASAALPRLSPPLAGLLLDRAASLPSRAPPAAGVPEASRGLPAGVSSRSLCSALGGTALLLLLPVHRRACGRSIARWRDRKRVTSVALHAGGLPRAATLGGLAAGVAASAEEDKAQLGEWCALVINLARRPDRLARLQELLSVTNPRLLDRLERVDAVDGQKLSLDSEAAETVVEASALARARRAKRLGLYTVVHNASNALVHFDDHMTAGAVACAMSHHKALERLATHPTAQWGLILEDDVASVVPDVDRAMARLLRALPSDWNAVFLGYHHDDGKPHKLGLSRGSPLPSVENAPRDCNGDEIAAAQAFEIHDHSWGLYAWMVTKEAAQSLVEDLFPIRSQVDYAISNWLVRNRGRVFCVNPDEMLLYSPTSQEGQDSDIQTMKVDEEVIEEHGSWQNYMQQLRPNEYDDYDMEDFYGLYYGDDSEEDDGGLHVNPEEDCPKTYNFSDDRAYLSEPLRE